MGNAYYKSDVSKEAISNNIQKDIPFTLNASKHKAVGRVKVVKKIYNTVCQIRS